jgi:hypothetical protein
MPIPSSASSISLRPLLGTLVLAAYTFGIVACGGQVADDGSGNGKGALGGTGGDPAPSGSGGGGSSGGSSGSGSSCSGPPDAESCVWEAGVGTGTIDGGTPGCSSPTSGGFAGAACLSYAELLAQAESSCTSAGARLVMMIPTVSSYCGGRFSYREFTCCTPDGADCVAHTDGSESSCKEYETWKTYSEDDCTRDGLVLTTLSVRAPCVPTTEIAATGATYTCCTP